MTSSVHRSVEKLEGSRIEIQESHKRGITLKQLHDVVRTSSDLCGIELWIDRMSGRQVAIGEANLYHCVEFLIKPATKARNVSWVEYIADSAAHQLPSQFVSHWCQGNTFS